MKLNNMKKMKRIVYGAPRSNTPAGGVKVIYKQSELVNQLGRRSAVWHPGEGFYRCTWFENHAEVINGELNAEDDFVILPEIWATGYHEEFINKEINYGIYVQNAYYTHVNLNLRNEKAIIEAYENAKIILSISKDSSKYIQEIFGIESNKIVLQRYSIDNKIFKPGIKKRKITYMPRKMEQHSNRVISILQNLIPKNWEIQAIDKMNEIDVASHLAESLIFLAFSEFEGLPVPPVEAGICGNIVIGYHGQGGLEYWDKPIYNEIHQGDIQNFILKILETINEIDQNGVDINKINSGIESISEYFSLKNEISMVQNFIKKVEGV